MAVRIVCHCPGVHQCEFIRFRTPAYIANSEIGGGVKVEVTDVATTNFTGVQSVVIQRPATENLVNLVAYYAHKRMEHKSFNIVFDFDDILWEVDKNPEYRENILKIAEIPNFVVVSNRELAREWKKISSRPAVVMPNSVSGFTTGKPHGNISKYLEKPVVFYGGSMGHDNDFSESWVKFLQDRIESGRIDFHCIVVPKCIEHLKDKVTTHPIQTPYEFLNYVSRLNPDFCIAPIADTKLNRCKSDLKIRECGALGCVFLGSELPSGPYNYLKNMVVRNDANIEEKFDWLCEPKNYNQCREYLEDLYTSRQWNVADHRFIRQWLNTYANGVQE